MKPIETKSCNAVYTLEGCLDLPATKFESNVGSGVECCFELEPGDLEEIQRTGRIYLDILGDGVPPVCISAKSSLILPETEGES